MTNYIPKLFLQAGLSLLSYVKKVEYIVVLAESLVFEQNSVVDAADLISNIRNSIACSNRCRYISGLVNLKSGHFGKAIGECNHVHFPVFIHR